MEKKGKSSKGDLNNTRIKLAAQHFLGSKEDSIREALQRTMEGHQRQILGTLTVEELYKDRKAFSAQVREHVFDDLAAMGFKLVSYTVNSISDNSDYMVSLGVTQTAIVKREAAEGKARNESEAKKKVAEFNAQAEIAEAHAMREAHVVVAQQQEQEAEADRDLNLKKAAFEREVNQANAEAKAAGPIESAKQQQAVVREETRQVQVREQINLDIADQLVAREQKEKEGTALAAMLAEKHKAEGIRVIANAEADRIKLLGQADAQVIREKGEAEAQVLERKANAYKQYGEAATIQMIIEKLPEIAKNVAEPLQKTEKMVFVSSDGSSGSQLTGDITRILGQLPDVVEGITGFDLREAVNSNNNKQKKDTKTTSQNGHSIV